MKAIAKILFFVISLYAIFAFNSRPHTVQRIKYESVSFRQIKETVTIFVKRPDSANLVKMLKTIFIRKPDLIKILEYKGLKLELVQAAIKAGANLNAKDKEGYNVLSKAIIKNPRNHKIAVALIEAGADVNSSTPGYIFPLELALKKAYSDGNGQNSATHPDLIKALIKAGAYLDSGEYLSTAILNNNSLEIISILLAAGANPNDTGRYEETALMFAAMGLKADIVLKLLEAGADPNLKSSDNKTAFDYAKESLISHIFYWLENSTFTSTFRTHPQ